MRKLLLTAALTPVALGAWLLFTLPLVVVQVGEAIEAVGEMLNLEMEDE